MIVSNEEIKDTMKIFKFQEYSGVFIKGATQTIESETIEQRGGFLSMLLGTLSLGLLGNMVAGKVVIRIGGPWRAGDGLPHSLINFDIQKYYWNEPKLKVVSSRNNIPNTVRGGAFVVNFDECKSIGAHQIALYANSNSVTYFEVKPHSKWNQKNYWQQKCQ